MCVILKNMFNNMSKDLSNHVSQLIIVFYDFGNPTSICS